jgi:hypothetical protein
MLWRQGLLMRDRRQARGEAYGMARPSFRRYGFAGSSIGGVDHEGFCAWR